MKRHWSIVMWMLLGTMGVTGAGTWWVVGTERGSGWLVARLLSRELNVPALAFGRFHGTLWRGLTADAVRCRGLRHFGPDSVLAARQAVLVPLPSMIAHGVNFELRDVELLHSPVAHEVSAAAIVGRVGRAVVQDLQLVNPVGLPHPSRVAIQELVVGLPLSPASVRAIRNARCWLPESDPILLFGGQANGQVDARLFSTGVNVREVLDTVIPSGIFPGTTGTIEALDLTVTGPHDVLTLDGTFRIARLLRRGFLMTQVPGRLAMTVTGPPGAWRLQGDVWLQGGAVAARTVTVQLRQGRVTLPRDGSLPVFDLAGRATIGATVIRARLSGTKVAPQLRLTSDPPRPQPILLMMLATGKPLRGAQEALGEGTISSDLATDFIDYFLFGGLGSRIGQAVGVTDLAIIQNSRTGEIGLETTLGHRVSVGIQIDPATLRDPQGVADPSASGPVPYKVGASYQATPTTSLEVEGERSLVHPGTPTTPAAPGTPSAQPQTDETVLFKVKRRF